MTVGIDHSHDCAHLWKCRLTIKTSIIIKNFCYTLHLFKSRSILKSQIFMRTIKILLICIPNFYPIIIYALDMQWILWWELSESDILYTNCIFKKIMQKVIMMWKKYFTGDTHLQTK